MEKLFFKWNELKATFWFVPVLIIFTSILLAIGLIYIDGHIEVSQEGMGRFFIVTSSDSARSILSTISGAMMGVAGTVFSITLVALTLASSQFGPRLIKKFMYDRLNQVVLGSYISTYLYCLIVLTTIRDTDDLNFIPSISILGAILAAVLNIILLIAFIHQIATSIQADKVISDISVFLSRQIETLFPEKMGEAKEENIDIPHAIAAYETCVSLKSPKNGYLQYVESDALVEMLCKHDSLLDLHFRPGGHLVEGLEIGILHSHVVWKEADLSTLLEYFIIGNTKTSNQDLEFSIQQMVGIGVRALSPGINDPFTAMACIDNLTATMSYLAQANFPSKYRFDEEEKLRVIADTFEFEGVLNAAFNQIRQFSGGSPAVIIRLMEALTTIHGFAKDEGRKQEVIKHAEMVLNMGKQTIKEASDLQDLIRRSNKILNY